MPDPRSTETPSIDVERYRRLPEPLYHEFNKWLLDEGLKGERLLWFRLLEGAIEADRVVTDEQGRILADGDRVRTERRIYTVSTPPPKAALTR